MKYLLIAYVALVALLLALRPAPAGKGPECGAGVLCIRTQKQVQAILAHPTENSAMR